MRTATALDNFRRFADDASHELRTPIAAITGYAFHGTTNAIRPAWIPRSLSVREFELTPSDRSVVSAEGQEVMALFDEDQLGARNLVRGSGGMF